MTQSPIFQKVGKKFCSMKNQKQELHNKHSYSGQLVRLDSPMLNELRVSEVGLELQASPKLTPWIEKSQSDGFFDKEEFRQTKELRTEDIQLGSSLGSGSCGEVFEGLDQKTGKFVACKLLKVSN